MSLFDPAIVTAVAGIISGVILVIATYTFFSPVELHASPRSETGRPERRRASRRQVLVEQPVVVLAERRRS